jgi:hypothetical protein
MPGPSPDDEGLKMVRRDEPASSQFAPPEAQRSAHASSPEGNTLRPMSAITIAIVAVLSIGLFTGFLIWGSGRVIREAHRQVFDGSPIRISADDSPPAPGLVTAEQLHVTSIVLGNPRLAVVNNKTVAEGSILEINTTKGVSLVRVTKIEEGVVRFKNGNQAIDGHLSSGLARPAGH